MYEIKSDMLMLILHFQTFIFWLKWESVLKFFYCIIL